MSEPDPIALWKGQQEESFSMSLPDIHARAERFQSRVRMRNWIEYGAGVLVVFIFGALAIETPDWGIRAATLLVVAGVGYIMWNLGKLASAASKDDAPGQSWIEFHRAQLVRQQRALASVWRWYIGPLVPGVVAVLVATAFARGTDLPLVARLASALMGGVWIALVFGAVGALNHYRAKQLLKEIEALDRARGDV